MHDHKQDRCLIGLELLSLHGFPASEIGATCIGTDSAVPSMFSDSELSRFASNGMSLPCIGSVLFAYTLNSKGPWWNVPSQSGPSEPPGPKRQKVDGSA
jgi:hypothetical protein